MTNSKKEIWGNNLNIVMKFLFYRPFLKTVFQS